MLHMYLWKHLPFAAKINSKLSKFEFLIYVPYVIRVILYQMISYFHIFLSEEDKICGDTSVEEEKRKRKRRNFQQITLTNDHFTKKRSLTRHARLVTI